MFGNSTKSEQISFFTLFPHFCTILTTDAEGNASYLHLIDALSYNDVALEIIVISGGSVKRKEK